MRRFARLRLTELPTFRLAVNPTRAPRADVRGCGAACRTKPGAATLRPSAMRRKSPRNFSVSILAATRFRLLEKRCAKSGHADKRLRPFARRAARTRRPAAVAIRARKPWRRLRTSLLGWYVRFTIAIPITASLTSRRGYIVSRLSLVNGAGWDAIDDPSRSRRVQVERRPTACHLGGGYHAG